MHLPYFFEQDYAKAKSVRVSILSGDVHLACYGQIFTRPPAGDIPPLKPTIPLEQDAGFIPEIVSSAMVGG